MSHSFFAFVQQLGETPALALFTLLTLGVLLVNGWTDAPNAIAGAVVTGFWRRCATLPECAA